MSKSVLVIDTPINCEWCIVRGGSVYCHCKLNQRNIEDIKKRPDWCPLMDLPEKDNGDYPANTVDAGFAEGWNQRIDEIAGGNSDD